jgi:VanZ family protein
LALGIAAWLKREAISATQVKLEPQPDHQLAVGMSVVAAIVMGLAFLWLEANIEIVCTYTFLGVALLILALYVESFVWQIGLTFTTCAFVYDLVEKFSEQRELGEPFAKWGMAALTALILGFLVARRQRAGRPMVRWAFLVLMWSAVVVSYFKSVTRFLPLGAQSIVELIFTLSAVALTWLIVKENHQEAGPELRN